MAVCWQISLAHFDKELAWSPERYSPDRAEFHSIAANSVPITDLVVLQKETFSPASKHVDPSAKFVVLDTNHAYEGRIQYRGQPVSISGVGSVKRPLSDGYVIISRLRTYLRQVALVDPDFIYSFDAKVLCSTEFYVLAPIGNTDLAFLVPFLLSGPVQRIFAAAEEGGHHPRIQPEVLMNLSVPRDLVDQSNELSANFRLSLQLIREGEQVLAELHKKTADFLPTREVGADGRQRERTARVFQQQRG